MKGERVFLLRTSRPSSVLSPFLKHLLGHYLLLLKQPSPLTLVSMSSHQIPRGTPRRRSITLLLDTPHNLRPRPLQFLIIMPILPLEVLA